jgi:hypothetical protein
VVGGVPESGVLKGADGAQAGLDVAGGFGREITSTRQGPQIDVLGHLVDGQAGRNAVVEVLLFALLVEVR